MVFFWSVQVFLWVTGVFAAKSGSPENVAVLLLWWFLSMLRWCADVLHCEKDFFQSADIIQIGDAEVNPKNAQNGVKSRFNGVFCHQNLPARCSCQTVNLCCFRHIHGFRRRLLPTTLGYAHLPKSIVIPSTVQRCRTETGAVSCRKRHARRYGKTVP